MHCSVIGTCLTTTALRSLMARLGAIDARDASDLDVHHAAVELAGRPGPAVKALHKALDDKHAPAIRRFGRTDDPKRLAELWHEAMEGGDVPGAYWAVLTHPQATSDLRKRAFGDVHMLSHLVGAANRADLRRLAALEAQQVELKAQADRQQERIAQLAAECDALQQQRAALELELHARRAAAKAAAADSEALAGLRDALGERERIVALHTARREVAERDALVARDESRIRAAELERARRTIDALLQEVAALEHEVAASDGDAARPHALQGRRIVYVGGRPSTSNAIRALVERAGGGIVTHDGGVEQRKGQFAASLPGADLVVFPVDCIDHDSVGTIKRLCERHGVPYRALRSASIASFAAAVADLGSDGSPAAESPRAAAARPCLRHG
ncbi:MAG: DUF2325 domain-containing protein [Proteobacteria bacterium]|nr:DUF2325 domain-containing protein [Pseudomonadota bacterium]